MRSFGTLYNCAITNEHNVINAIEDVVQSVSECDVIRI